MGSTLNLRDKSRTSAPKTVSMRKANTAPPKDQGSWIGLSAEFFGCAAFLSLSPNAFRALSRLILEHLLHAGLENGRLICTHTNFEASGCTRNLIADAVDELKAKGFIRIQRGRAADGTPHPNLYTLTFTGTYDGLPATNEWRRVTEEQAKGWKADGRKVARKHRATKKILARTSASVPARTSANDPVFMESNATESRYVSMGDPTRHSASTLYSLAGGRHG